MNSMVNLSDMLGNSLVRDITCQNHGQQIEQVIFGKAYGCPVCADERLKAAAATALEDAVKNTLIQSGIPSEFHRMRFSSLVNYDDKQSRLINRLVEYCQDIKTTGKVKNCRNIILMGDTGTGKTTLAALIARGVVAMSYSINADHEVVFNDRLGVIFTTGAAIKSDITFSWTSEATRHEQEIIRELCNVPVLVIDEVGVADGFSKTHDIYSVIIDGRYKNQLPTIITTNLDEHELKKHMGERVDDRLFEYAIKANCGWLSYRKKTQNVEVF